MSRAFERYRLGKLQGDLKRTNETLKQTKMRLARSRKRRVTLKRHTVELEQRLGRAREAVHSLCLAFSDVFESGEMTMEVK